MEFKEFSAKTADEAIIKPALNLAFPVKIWRFRL